MTQHRATITRLDIAGFKSFADDVHLDILPGLTGIVGPNGCGKSNIVEALRWTMGESSARALRGGESDDLIFAGTGARPSRNLAKVTLSLENAQNLAPPPFHESDELNISRQAERGRGSTYRINNQTMRARDVQTLFADLSSGARSSSIISQNRVSQLIAAKPEERRSLLEEAAGITGLYARRRDAELKLRQSENNLERAEDRRQQLEKQLSVLEEQSSQARHYRGLSQEIRETELHLLTLQHARAGKAVRQHQHTLKQTQNALREAEENVRSAEQQLQEQESVETSYQETLEKIRPIIEELRVHVRVAQQNLEHSDKTQKETAERLKQIESDLERQKKTREQLSARKNALCQEIENLRQKSISFPEQQQDLEKQLENLTQEEHEKERALQTLSASYHQAALHQETLKSRLSDRQEQLRTELQRLEAFEEEHASLHQEKEKQPSLKQALKDSEQANAQALSIQQNLQEAQRKHHEQSINATLAAHSFEQAKETAARLESRLRTTGSHLDTLKKRLQSHQDHRHKLQHTLLSDEKKKEMEDAITRAQRAAHKAHEHEKQALTQKEQAEQSWLNERAQHDTHQQQRHALSEENRRLAHSISQQEERCRDAEAFLHTLHTDALSTNDSTQDRKACADLELTLTKHSQALLAAQKELKTAQQREEKARHDVMSVESDLSQCHAECEGLQQSLGSSETQTPNPIIDHIHVPEDLTRALACALTDGLEASLSAPSESSTDNHYVLRHWVHLPSFKEENPAPFPELVSLASYIEAPKSLARALRSVFLVDDVQQGYDLQEKLAPGQSLVSRDGHVWRWDGFVRSDKAPSAEAIRLEQQQRLHSRSREIETLTEALEKARKVLRKDQDVRATCHDKVTNLSKEEQALKDHYNRQRFRVSELERQLAFHRERLSLAQNHLTEHNNTLHDLTTRLKNNEAALKALPEDRRDNLREAEKNTHAMQERARLAHVTHQECQEKLHTAQRSYERAQLHHKSTQERLTELHDACEHLNREIATLGHEYQQLQQELKNVNLQTLDQQVHTQNDALTHLATQLQQTQRAYNDAKQNAELCAHRHAQLERDLTTLTTRTENALQRYNAQKKELTLLENDITRLSKENAALPDITATQQNLTQSQNALESLREHIREVKNQYSQLQQEKQNHLSQNEALRQQYDTLEDTWRHLCEEEKELTQRREELQSIPEHSEKEHHDLQQTISRHSEKHDTLEQERQLTHERLKVLRQEKEKLTSDHRREREKEARYREEVVRVKERLEHAQQAHAALCQNSPLPENLPSLTDITAHAEQRLRRHMKRYMQERDSLGPVNLCAEEEFQKAHTESEHLRKEHTDLTSAIARLRGGIGAINRQGRTKLTNVFTEINAHFQSLFERMFGGGKAHLALIGSDDPLEAGLEIFAQPPGKKLSTLSLLSGGEQALTALSLIFAAFHCTPAPLCVLDEVDAPLDDANTERFCHLLTDMTQQTKTRFLIVTHHQLTMAHMDRLFGVTMQERGVSRLLSVNLDESIKMADG